MGVKNFQKKIIFAEPNLNDAFKMESICLNRQEKEWKTIAISQISDPLNQIFSLFIDQLFFVCYFSIITRSLAVIFDLLSLWIKISIGDFTTKEFAIILAFEKNSFVTEKSCSHPFDWI